jgi:hypothetical protein
MQADNGQPIALGDGYTLTLDDGKSAAVLVTSTTSSSSGPGVTSFKGNGPPPKSGFDNADRFTP